MTMHEQRVDNITPADHIALPDTPASQHLVAYLAAVNSGDSDHIRRLIAERYDPSLLARVSIEIQVWNVATLRRNTGGLAVTAIEEEAEDRIVVRARPLAPVCPLPRGCRIALDVAPEAPHRIIELVAGPDLSPPVVSDIGGRRLSYSDSGMGSPTVVLEAGWGWGAWAWTWVFAGIAQETRVIAYDRAEIGASDPAPPGPRSAGDMAADLHALLSAAHVPGPYILVGHSFGGLIVRLFARDHPFEIAGMILIDAVHEEAWGGREQALLPPEAPDEHPGLAGMRHWLTKGMYEPETLPERLDVVRSVAEGRACASLGNRPLVVFRAGNYTPPPDFPSVVTAAIEALRREIHFDFTRLSSNSTYIVAERSGHIVQYDEPELVLGAVLQVVNAVRSRLWVTDDIA